MLAPSTVAATDHSTNFSMAAVASEPAKSFLARHWRKGLVLATLASAGALYVHSGTAEKRAQYATWRAAADIGSEPLPLATDKPRRLTVILNPAAGKRNAKRIFEQEVAPVFHLAGIDYGIVETERVGQAKEIASFIELAATDGIVVVGGDGVLQEVLTGLLRRPDIDEVRKKPVGVIPIGATNGSFASLFASSETAAWLAGIRKHAAAAPPSSGRGTAGAQGEAPFSPGPSRVQRQLVEQKRHLQQLQVRQRLETAKQEVARIEAELKASAPSSVLGRFFGSQSPSSQMAAAVLNDKLNAARLEYTALAKHFYDISSERADMSGAPPLAPAVFVTEDDVKILVDDVLSSATQSASAAALAIARGNTRSVDVLEITAEGQKKVYGLGLLGLGIPSMDIVSTTSWNWVKHRRYELSWFLGILKKAKPTFSANISFRDPVTGEWRSSFEENLLALLVSGGSHLSQRLQLYPSDTTTKLPWQVIPALPPSPLASDKSAAPPRDLPPGFLYDGKVALAVLRGPQSNWDLVGAGQQLHDNSRALALGNSSASVHLPPAVQVVQVNEFKVEPVQNKRNTQLNIDGELFDLLPFHVKVLQKFITVYS